MPYIEYIPRRFGALALERIQIADQICRSFAGQGLDLTLRQLYYQFVAHHGLPNKESEYKNLGALVSNARLAGMINWNHLVDRGRSAQGGRFSGYATPRQLIEGLSSRYVMNLWEGQTSRVEAWVEKDALSGVLQRAAGRYRIPYFACKGYVSQSAMWQAAQRIEGWLDTEGVERVLVLHLGDHDPSGIDMTRDIEARMLSTFLRGDGYDETDVEIRRIALNMDQVQQYDPPPNPAKLTDSRVGNYLARYGESSWELDALEPTVLVSLIQQHIAGEVDDDLWAERVELEEEGEQELQQVEDRWDDIVDYLKQNPS